MRANKKRTNNINLNRSKYINDNSILEDNCKCSTCRIGITKSYIHLLIKENELMAYTLITATEFTDGETFTGQTSQTTAKIKDLLGTKRFFTNCKELRPTVCACLLNNKKVHTSLNRALHLFQN